MLTSQSGQHLQTFLKVRPFMNKTSLAESILEQYQNGKRYFVDLDLENAPQTARFYLQQKTTNS